MNAEIHDFIYMHQGKLQNVHLVFDPVNKETNNYQEGNLQNEGVLHNHQYSLLCISGK